MSQTFQDEESQVQQLLAVPRHYRNADAKTPRTRTAWCPSHHPVLAAPGPTAPAFTSSLPPTPLRCAWLRRLDAITILTGLLMLIGPLWLLNLLSTEKAKLTAISVLVSGFVGLLGIGTGAKPFETLAAAAG
jgi:hypothetical protein